MPEAIAVSKKKAKPVEEDEIVEMFRRGLEDLKAGRVKRVR